MSVDLYFRKELLDHAVLSDDESSAFDAHHLPAVHALFFVDTVCRCHLPFGVGEQGHIQTVLVPEPGLLRDVVRTDPNDNGSSLFNLGFCIAEPGCLPGSARRVSLGIEKQYDLLLAGVIAEARLPAMVVLQRKGGGSASFLQHMTSEQGMDWVRCDFTIG